MSERSTRWWLWFLIPCAPVGLLGTVWTLFMLLDVMTPTCVVIVNGGPESIGPVTLEVEDAWEETIYTRETLTAAEFASGQSWEVKLARGPMMPVSRLTWCEGEQEYEHSERTDLWKGQTWRIEILPGGRVKSGYWSDGSWVTEDERPAGRPRNSEPGDAERSPPPHEEGPE